MTNQELMQSMQQAGRLEIVSVGAPAPKLPTIAEIVGSMNGEQKRASRESLGDALDIVSGIVGDMPYSRLFTITASVVENL